MNMDSAAASGSFSRRCVSEPNLSALSTADGEYLEVYVAARAFTECGGQIFQKLPPEFREHMVDIGLCHYMTVLRHPDGRLTQFDFGPRGGDITKPGLELLRQLPTITATKTKICQTQEDDLQPVDLCDMVEVPDVSPVGGEIREKQLQALPEAHLYVGRTYRTLEEIRMFNQVQHLEYQLHHNDCRHYVNSLVKFSTGFDQPTSLLKRHVFRHKTEGRWQLHHVVIEATQTITDVGNWEKICTSSQAAVAAWLGYAGRNTLSILWMTPRRLLPVMQESGRAALTQVGSRGLPQPLAAMAAMGTITAVARHRQSVPLFRDIRMFTSRVGAGVQRFLGQGGQLFRVHLAKLPSRQDAARQRRQTVRWSVAKPLVRFGQGCARSTSLAMAALGNQASGIMKTHPFAAPMRSLLWFGPPAAVAMSQRPPCLRPGWDEVGSVNSGNLELACEPRAGHAGLWWSAPFPRTTTSDSAVVKVLGDSREPSRCAVRPVAMRKDKATESTMKLVGVNQGAVVIGGRPAEESKGWKVGAFKIGQLPSIPVPWMTSPGSGGKSLACVIKP